MRVVRRWLGFGGTLMATLFFCASLTPTLLPRTWVMQGVMGAVTGIIGYAFGATAGAFGRATLKYRITDRARRVAWRVLLAGCALLSALALGYSLGWQRDLRELMGMDTEITWFPPVILAVAVAGFALFLFIGRVIRLGGRKLIHWLDRFVPVPIAQATGIVIVTCVIGVLANDVLFSGFVNAMNDVSSVTNTTTAPGVAKPVSAKVSGGPGSLVPWETLGREGRSFTGTAVSRAELTAFSGSPATEPIRAYVGLEAAATPDQQAATAVRELERTGGFGRPVLAVLGTTGTGWVDQHLADSLEFMYNGDSAMVAMQYSYLPSWASFLVDRGKAARAGQALFDAVRARWERVPKGERPLLVVSGESLGSYELEGAFGDLRALTARADGALFVGPPDANPIWSEVTAGREPDSPVWRPVYERGRTVRFAQYPDDLRVPPGPWEHPRVVYLQNASDPVVWWSPRLLYKKPEWLTGPRGPDVNPQMNWFPLVTFWQVLVDMSVAQDVPEGHGHRYGANMADGWAAIAAPDGWAQTDTDRLHDLISGRPSP
ncbi:alpha/beta-hydrolase family protein [Nonomuraea sp. NBC_01738]|uniref:alpha/beta hydrolase n=1 Tax=Nonomuraea sp. NBC_01738 TaxID=2976003 RepID=UPI002E103DC1|nr:alpha/beta-hydrolase family protein [Nonomuraea sp. NBC_01738]